MHGLTGRMGGDEFVMLIPGNSQKHIELLSKWADKKHFFMQKGISFEYSVSVGYAFYPEHAVGLIDLIHKADKAAYHIKRVKGINSFCYNSVLEQEHRLNGIQRQRSGIWNAGSPCYLRSKLSGEDIIC